MKVITVEGGRSAEWEISLVSAKWVAEQLSLAGHEVTRIVIDRDGGWALAGSGEKLSLRTTAVPWGLHSGSGPLAFDVVFPVLHGSYGEDGTIQGLCETAGWKYAGVPVLGSSVAMDKHTMKSLAAQEGLPVVPWVHIDENRDSCFDCLQQEILELGFPMFIKPSRLGSSVGISRITGPEQIRDALEKAMRHDSRILFERAVEEAREIEVSVIGDGVQVLSSVPGEVLPGKDWYDYQAKYDCPESKLSIPAELSASLTEDVRLMAERVFRITGGRGYARVDFLLNHRGVWFNEMNTIPGFTDISMFPKLWKASGMEPGSLLDYILEEALNRTPYGLGTGE